MTTNEGKVGLIGIVVMTAYFILLSILLLCVLVQLWQSPLAAEKEADQPSPPAAQASPPPRWLITFGFIQFSIPDEGRVFFIVALTGALGALVHALRSFYWYVGHRELVWSWAVKYILLPFVGSTLGIIFYFVVRGGFFSPGASAQETSPFGFAAMAGLVGMFSEPAILKLKQVAETLFIKPKPGSNAKPQEIEGAAPAKTEEAATSTIKRTNE